MIIVANDANFDIRFLSEFLKNNCNENSYIRFADILKLMVTIIDKVFLIILFKRKKELKKPNETESCF